MRIGPFTMDTENMTSDMVNDWIKELKHVRARKARGDEFIRRLNELIADIRAEGFAFCCRNTGEVLDPKYWVLYDLQEHCEHVSNEYVQDGES